MTTKEREEVGLAVWELLNSAGGGDGVALRYLESKGWTDAGGGLLKSPHESNSEEPLLERVCMNYLFHEWDYGQA